MSQVDHRNDIVVNLFGLIMSIVGDRFVWYLDPVGAICIALLILFSWVANAFEQVWLLVGKSAPAEFISKLIYISMTHDPQILKVDTVREWLRSILILRFFFFLESNTAKYSVAHTMPDRSTTSKSTPSWTSRRPSRSRTT